MASPEIEDAVLDATRDCVLAYGVRRTTVSDVARRAGVSRMSIYRRWPDVHMQPEETLQAHLDVQVKAAFLLSQACLPAMIDQGVGRIVNITSQVTDGAAAVLLMKERGLLKPFKSESQPAVAAGLRDPDATWTADRRPGADASSRGGAGTGAVSAAAPPGSRRPSPARQAHRAPGPGT